MEEKRIKHGPIICLYIDRDILNVQGKVKLNLNLHSVDTWKWGSGGAN